MGKQLNSNENWEPPIWKLRSSIFHVTHPCWVNINLQIPRELVSSDKQFSQNRVRQIWQEPRTKAACKTPRVPYKVLPTRPPQWYKVLPRWGTPTMTSWDSQYIFQQQWFSNKLGDPIIPDIPFGTTTSWFSIFPSIFPNSAPLRWRWPRAPPSSAPRTGRAPLRRRPRTPLTKRWQVSWMCGGHV